MIIQQSQSDMIQIECINVKVENKNRIQRTDQFNTVNPNQNFMYKYCGSFSYNGRGILNELTAFNGRSKIFY